MPLVGPGPGYWVCLVDHQRQMSRDQPKEQCRHQQDVHHVEPRDDELAGELTGEGEELRPGSNTGIDGSDRQRTVGQCPTAGRPAASSR